MIYMALFYNQLNVILKPNVWLKFISGKTMK